MTTEQITKLNIRGEGGFIRNMTDEEICDKVDEIIDNLNHLKEILDSDSAPANANADELDYDRIAHEVKNRIQADLSKSLDARIAELNAKKKGRNR